jgi:hypothetical protein
MTSLPSPPPPPQAVPQATYPPPPPQAPYQQPHHAPATPKVDGLAIASLVLGILWLYWIGSILAIIFGAIAIQRINKSNGWRTGKGMAIAGLVLGILGAVFLALFMLVFAAAGTTSQNNSDACSVERRTIETAVEAYYASTGNDPRSSADLVNEGFLVEAGTNYTVSAGVVKTSPNGRC